jgi:hypothetical protein
VVGQQGGGLDDAHRRCANLSALQQLSGRGWRILRYASVRHRVGGSHRWRCGTPGPRSSAARRDRRGVGTLRSRGAGGPSEVCCRTRRGRGWAMCSRGTASVIEALVTGQGDGDRSPGSRAGRLAGRAAGSLVDGVGSAHGRTGRDGSRRVTCHRGHLVPGR